MAHVHNDKPVMTKNIAISTYINSLDYLSTPPRPPTSQLLLNILDYNKPGGQGVEIFTSKSCHSHLPAGIAGGESGFVRQYIWRKSIVVLC